MHHSTVRDEDDITWYVLHNGDYSGDVILRRHLSDDEIRIPFRVMEEIVGSKLLADELDRLEQLRGREFLLGRTVRQGQPH